MMALDVEGLAQARAQMAVLTARFVDAFEAAEFSVASDILTELLPEVPRQTGALVASRAVTRTMPVQIVFGADYAAAQHERGRQRKWLQRPFSQASSSMASRVAQRTALFVESGTTLASVPAQHPTTPSSPASTRRRPQRSR
jgi:hypothetical protein